MKLILNVWYLAIAFSANACSPLDTSEPVTNVEMASGAESRAIADLPFPANQIKVGMSHSNVLQLLEGTFERSFNPRIMALGAWCEGYTIDHQSSQEFLQIHFTDDKVTRINVVASDVCVIF
ncbi:hypothetical protein SAMN05444003_0967 [Cognatiyoonia sediminum]|uniref:Uncharacterized protein n=1 Tax=Cognatiyoonia sediminum TaxID=1508389 RepID=A0A1M5MR39_9RHOB|nr:hypothetical protein [Cognatiyoonia sediminum]SHG79676.1 hypothetical protein SAMN05444003_0967 [Cognatiyoonia sediminum]